MRGLALLLAVVGAYAAVDGTVTNGATGKPQPGATVTLYRLSSKDGLDAVVSVKSDAEGKFAMSETPSGGPHLVQSAFDGVTYNHMLPPGRPSTGLKLTVYPSTKQPGAAKVSTHMVLFEANGMELTVNESFVFTNEGKASYNDPDNGTLRFRLPGASAGKVKIMCTAPQGMPIERAAKKTAKENIYAVDFPVKPGETRIDVVYSMPMTGPAEFAGESLTGGALPRLVAPQGLTLKTDDATLLGQEPSTQASVYETKKATYKVTLEGTGSLRPETQGPDEDEAPGIKETRPRLYDRFLPILGLLSVILLAGLGILARRAPAKK